MGNKSLFLVLLLAGIGYADTGFRDMISMTETDGSPSCMAGQVKVQPGQLACSGNTATLNITGGTGGSSALESIFDPARSSPTATLKGNPGDLRGSVSGSTMTISLSTNVARTDRNQTWYQSQTYALALSSVTLPIVNVSSMVVWADGSISTTAATGGGAGVADGSPLPLPADATNYIQNRATLQAGSTFYTWKGYVEDGVAIGGDYPLSVYPNSVSNGRGITIHDSGGAGEKRGLSVYSTHGGLPNSFSIEIASAPASLRETQIGRGERLIFYPPLGPGYPVTFRLVNQNTYRQEYVLPTSTGAADSVLAIQSTDGKDTNLYWKTDAGSAAWGDITGTLSDQTDLQGKFDALGTSTSTLKTQIDNKIVSISTGVVGVLPYKVSLSTAVMGELPYKVSLSTGVIGTVTAPGDNLGNHVATMTVTIPSPYGLATSTLQITGAGTGVLTMTEGTAPSGVASSGVLYADSTAHWFSMINNNGDAYKVVGSSTTPTAGKCASWSASGALIAAPDACGTGTGGGGGYYLEPATVTITAPKIIVSTLTVTSSMTIQNVSTMTFSGVAVDFSSMVYLTGNPGTDGQVLTSKGRGLAPVWQTAAGGGGSSSLATWDGSALISSPTAGIRFREEQFVGTLAGSATAEFELNASTVTLLGPTLDDAEIPDNITLTNINQITNRSHTNLSDIGTQTHAQLDARDDAIAVSTNTLKTQIDNKIVSLSTGVVGELPYQVSLSTGIMGTLAASSVGNGMTDAQVNNDITLTNITQVSNRSHTNLSDIGVHTHAQIDADLEALATSTTSLQSAQWATGIATGTIKSTVDAQGARLELVATSTNTIASNLNLTAISTGTLLTLSSATATYFNRAQIPTCSGTDKVTANGTVFSCATDETSAGGGYATIDDEDTPLTQRTTLNFEGAGVTCADDTDQTTCTIPGGGTGAGDSLGTHVATMTITANYGIIGTTVAVSTITANYIYTSTLTVTSSMTITNVSTMSFVGVGVNFSSTVYLTGSPGTSGQSLRSRGPGAAPVWENTREVVVSTGDIKFTGSTLQSIPSMSLTLAANTTYSFEFFILHQTTVTTAGARMAVNVVTASTATFAYTVRLPIAADGAGGELQGWGSGFADPVVGTAVQAVNTPYIGDIRGLIVTGGTGGTLVPMAASELGGSPQIQINKSSIGYLRKI